MAIEAKKKKLVIVGDGACGKSCLLIVFTKGSIHIWRHQFISREWGGQKLKKIWWRVVVNFIYSEKATKIWKKYLKSLWPSKKYKNLKTDLLKNNVDYGEGGAKRSGDVIYGCPNYPK